MSAARIVFDIWDEMTPSQRAGAFWALFPIAVIVFFITNSGLFSKLQVIVWANWGFWFYITLGFIFAFWNRYKYPRDYVWAEVPIQVGTHCIAVFLFFNLFFYIGSDLADVEAQNGATLEVVHDEEYTANEDCNCVSCNCDEEGNCSTCCDTCCSDYNGPQWSLRTSNGEEVSTTSSVFANYVRKFGNKRYESVMRIGQCSVGDGNRYITTWDGDINRIVPTARPHRFVNYLKANDSVRKSGESNKVGFEDCLVGYPTVHGGPFGEIELDRVIRACGAPIPNAWAAEVDRGLDIALADLGKEKEVNILVYFVGSQDLSFLHALEAHWVMGKKNDVIVIVGVTSYPEISWTAVMAWTDNELFKITLRDAVQDLGSLDNVAPIDFVRTITSQVADGFERLRMRDIPVGDVKMDLWAQFLLLVVCGFLSWLISWALRNNTWRVFGNTSSSGSDFDSIRRW